MFSYSVKNVVWRAVLRKQEVVGDAAKFAQVAQCLCKDTNILYISAEMLNIQDENIDLVRKEVHEIPEKDTTSVQSFMEQNTSEDSDCTVVSQVNQEALIDSLIEETTDAIQRDIYPLPVVSEEKYET